MASNKEGACTKTESAHGNPERCSASTRTLISSRMGRTRPNVAPCRIGEFPVFVALTGIERARVSASHRDHDIDSSYDFFGPGLRELCSDVDPTSSMASMTARVDLRGRL